MMSGRGRRPDIISTGLSSFMARPRSVYCTCGPSAST